MLHRLLFGLPNRYLSCYYSMDYSQFTGITVRAIKQQQTHIISQENEIISLKQQLAIQQSQIDTLIQRLAAANIA